MFFLFWMLCKVNYKILTSTAEKGEEENLFPMHSNEVTKSREIEFRLLDSQRGSGSELDSELLLPI